VVVITISEEEEEEMIWGLKIDFNGLPHKQEWRMWM